jgi:hypothetical protein
MYLDLEEVLRKGFKPLNPTARDKALLAAVSVYAEELAGRKPHEEVRSLDRFDEARRLLSLVENPATIWKHHFEKLKIAAESINAENRDSEELHERVDELKDALQQEADQVRSDNIDHVGRALEALVQISDEATPSNEKIFSAISAVRQELSIALCTPSLLKAYRRDVGHATNRMMDNFLQSMNK